MDGSLSFTAVAPQRPFVEVDGLVVDNFAGGGGASLGIEWALGRPVDIAINHDEIALRMHRASDAARAVA